MAIVRELTTLFTFQTENKGLLDYQKKVNSTMATMKRGIAEFGAVLGVAFSISAVVNFTKSLASAVEQAEFLAIQMKQIITPDLDSEKLLKGVFDYAQEAGQVYADVANDFKNMAIAAREFGVNQETALQATINISKSMEVGRASAEESSAAMNAINTAMKRGQLGAKQFGELAQKAPVLIRTLGQALGMTTAQMRKLAEDGKLTTDVLINGFAKANAQLDKEFMEKPNTLGESLNYVWNELTRLGQAIWKFGGGTSKLADGIVWLTKKIVSFGDMLVEMVGGTENALSLLQKALFAALGLGTIKLITTFASSMRAMAVATSLATIQFTAIVAAIALLALAFEDIYGWVQGKDSITGRLIGSFEEVSAKFQTFIKPFQELVTYLNPAWEVIKNITSGILSLAESFGKFLILDFSGAFKAWNEAVTTFQNAFNNFDMEGFKTTVSAAFDKVMELIKAPWEWLKTLSVGTIFEPITQAILDIHNVVADVIKAIWNFLTGDFTAAFTNLGNAWDTIKGYLSGIVEYIDKVFGITEKWNTVVNAVLTAVNAVKNVFEWLSNLTFGALNSALETISGVLGKMADAARWVGNALGIEGGGAKKPLPGQSANEPIAPLPTPAPPAGADTRTLWEQWAPGWLGGQEAPIPATPPGAITNSPVSNTQNNNVPITQNVTINGVTGDNAKAMTDATSKAADRMAEDAARELTRAMPRMEAAAG